MGKMSKEVPRPLFSMESLSHLCSCYGYFPKPLFPFQNAVLFLSLVSNISLFFLTDFSHHR